MFPDNFVLENEHFPESFPELLSTLESDTPLATRQTLAEAHPSYETKDAALLLDTPMIPSKAERKTQEPRPSSVRVDGQSHLSKNAAKVASYASSRAKRFAARMLVVGWQNVIATHDSNTKQ